MDGEVHIWKAWVDDAKLYSEPLIANLAQNERLRGARLVDPERGQRYLLAQGVLRDVLSRYLNQSAASIEFYRGQYGKPYIKSVDLQFNLTHSNDCVLVAVTMGQEIGIDVEFLEQTHRFDDLIERFFAEEEQREYQLLDSEAARRLAFYRGWTRKEAYLKAMGVGLSYPLDQFAVSLAPEDRHALLHVGNDTTVHTKWTLLSFNVDEQYLASVAIEAPIERLQTYRWSFSSSA